MRKRLASLFAVTIGLLLSLGILTACRLQQEPDRFPISFYDDTQLVDVVETSGNERIRLPEASEKEGYIFCGWFFDRDSWQEQLTEDTYADRALTAAVDVYAYYRQEEPSQPESPATYTVTFETNGGTAVAPVTTSLIESEPKTSQSGYTFSGWYTESGFVNKAEFPYEVTKAQTLYAKWEKNKYTVTFETNGGTVVAPVTTSLIESEPKTSQSGYTFLGWYTESSFVNKAEFPYEVTKVQTLYAKWEKNAPESIVFTVDKNGVLTGVSGISAQTARVEVPSEVNGITVTEIAKDVFKDNREIEALILPDTVGTLGYRMCSGCSALKELRLPSGLTVIPDEAFADCVSLKAVVFPDTLVQIRSDAFSGSGLTEFIAPRALASIWLNAFMGCRDLEKIDLGQVQSIRSGAFQDCTALKAVKIPETVVSLTNETYIFGGCTSLKTIDMPDNPVPISYTLLNGSGYYNDPANWENGVLYVDGYLVDTNDTFLNVTEYAVREGTIVIADNAFYTPGYGSKLKTLSLPQPLRHIGKAAFSKCVSLAEIDMKDGIRSIGYNAFAGTVYEKNEKNWTDNGLYLGNWLIAVKKVSMTSFTVREGTVGVADANDESAGSLFPSLARKITSLTLPSSLKYIGVRSFARTQITEVTLPKGLLQIGKGAFYSCSFLQNVNLGDCASLESIGDMAFQECMIGEIAIPESVTKMGELVFNHNTVDLTIRCAVSEKPEGWDSDWAYSYRQGVTVTVEWKKA